MNELATVLPYFRPYRRGFFWGLVLVVLANTGTLATPYLVKLAIDGMSDPAVTRSDIALLAAMIVAATIVGGAARFGMRELLNGISRRMEVDLRNDFFRHLLRLDATFYGTTRTGDLMSRTTNDTLAVRMAVGPAVMYTVNTVVSFVFALALMLYISPRLTLYAVIPLACLPPIVLGFGRVIHRRFEQIQEQFSTLSTMVQENLTGVRIVRAYTRENEQARRFDDLNGEYRRRNMGLALSAGAFHPILMFFSGLAMVIVLWLGSHQVIAGSITVGEFVAFGFYLVLLIWPMIALGWVVTLYQRGAASMGRLNEILHAEPAVAAPEHPVHLASPEGRVEFRNVSFRYPGTERDVLEDVSFVARPGETVAIVGPTGSGKTTMLGLIARLYDATGGEVSVDGVPVTRMDPGELRLLIGMVPQDPFLFSDTLAANIALDDARGPHVRSPEVERAASIAQLHDQVQRFPDGYATMLGERGINLSGGQKQRATLARAIARDPVILMLDDALSAVDTHTEAKILEDLRDVMKGRTSFIVSHRVSAVMGADQILVLDGARIVERGTHAQLIAADGTYARLLRRQMLEESLEDDLAGATATD